ncbi:MAG: hypothetical protein JW801_15525, partial [Bacteroidales bacterium]|nr:hypothetical protein [Bacteroidales bacterium]
WFLGVGINFSQMYNGYKSYGNTIRCVYDSQITWTCGQPLHIIHTAGNVAPVNKTVDYVTVETDLAGSTRCWIAQNLGADHQAASAYDATEESAGWYWQFNRKQGYKHDGTIRTPNTPWNTYYYELNDWTSDNDPCTLLLGTGWRIPTATEWNNADLNGGWNNINHAYSSVLRIHAAGFLTGNDGYLEDRGLTGRYWSKSSNDFQTAWCFGANSSQSSTLTHPKEYGFTLRCLKE